MYTSFSAQEQRTPAVLCGAYSLVWTISRYSLYTRAEPRKMGGEHGYVHKVYMNIIQSKSRRYVAARSFYLCGWRHMIDETKKLEMGFDKNAIPGIVWVKSVGTNPKTCTMFVCIHPFAAAFIFHYSCQDFPSWGTITADSCVIKECALI